MKLFNYKPEKLKNHQKVEKKNVMATACLGMKSVNKEIKTKQINNNRDNSKRFINSSRCISER